MPVPSETSVYLSVVVPVYNGAGVLPESVPALLAQDFDGSLEILYVDDGSTDGSADLLDRLTRPSERSVRILRHETNRGRSAARNTGIAAATGERIALLDADAAPEPGYLQALNRALDHPGAVAAVGTTRLAEPNDEAYHRYFASSLRGPRVHDPAASQPWKYFISGVAMLRAAVFEELGGFDEAIPYGEDFELACRMAERWPEGLRFQPAARVRLFEVDDLDGAARKLHQFGRDALPLIVQRYGDGTGRTPNDVVVSAAGRHGLLRRLLVREPFGRWARRLLPVLPVPLANLAVRYVLGVAVAEGVRSSPSGS